MTEMIREPAPPQPSHRRVLAASLLGTTVEWYDFFIYGTAAALIFSTVFFPSGGSATGTLTAFAAFGAGFVMRPLGAVIIGHLGDKYGRRPMLMGTVLMMGLATVAIGVLPSYAAIGIWAPTLLVLLRLVQGFAVGGEWGGAALMAVENAPAHRRALYGAFTQAAVPIAYVLSTGVFLVVEGSMSEQALLSWGWRIPFLISIVVVGVTVFIRSGVQESPEFAVSQRKPERLPIVRVLTRYPLTVLATIGATIATSTDNYLANVFLLSYGTAEAGVERDSMLTINLVCAIMTVGLTLSAGHVADRIGHRRVALIGLIGLVLMAFPTFLVVNTGEVWAILVIRLVSSVFAAMVYAPIAAILASTFSVHIRYTGVSLGYQTAAIIGGGFAPFIAQALLELTGTWVTVASYYMAVCLISLLAMSLLPKAARREDRDGLTRNVTQPSAA